MNNRLRSLRSTILLWIGRFALGVIFLLSCSITTIQANPILPPKWAFGILYGAYYDQVKVLDVMQRLRNEYSGDLIWVDSHWLGYDDPLHYIDFRIDHDQFPDPVGMIDTLHDNHFKFGVWEWPYIDRSNTEIYNEAKNNGYFITSGPGSSGNVVNAGGWHKVTFTGMIDFTNPDARTWWKQKHQPLLDMGFDFFKLDTYGGKPDGGVLYNDSLNLGKQYVKTVFEITEEASGERGFIIVRPYPFPNHDQYPGVWTGDHSTLIDDMERAANHCPSVEGGVYWGGDTGGFGGAKTDEVYARWLQYSFFTPITEVFGGSPRFPWNYGTQAQEIFKKYARLRYRLLPFRYSNAQKAYHETPVKYPVRFVSGRNDEIILGNNDSEMLVAPIHDTGATTGDAHLPSGNNWIDYWTEDVYPGGSVPTVSAPLNKVPIFVKAGAIIPMGPEMGYIDQLPPNPITLDIYPSSGRSSYKLYEDDGTSKDYQQGIYAATIFSCNKTESNDIVVDIGARIGSYSGMPGERYYRLQVHQVANTPTEIKRDTVVLTRYNFQSDLESANEGWYYDSNKDIVYVKPLESLSKAFRISILASAAPSFSPTPSPTCAWPGDVNCDGDIDKDDALAVLQNWLSSSPTPSGADINSDGKVNGMDFGQVIKDWGQSS